MSSLQPPQVNLASGSFNTSTRNPNRTARTQPQLESRQLLIPRPHETVVLRGEVSVDTVGAGRRRVDGCEDESGAGIVLQGGDRGNPAPSPPAIIERIIARIGSHLPFW